MAPGLDPRSRRGRFTALNVRPPLLADGSAAAVTLTNRFAYVSEKNGSLEAFAPATTEASAWRRLSGVSPV